MVTVPIVSSTSAGLEAVAANARGELAAVTLPTRATDRTKCCRSISVAWTRNERRNTRNITRMARRTSSGSWRRQDGRILLTRFRRPLIGPCDTQRSTSLALFVSLPYSLRARFIVGRPGMLLLWQCSPPSLPLLCVPRARFRAP